MIYGVLYEHSITIIRQSSSFKIDYLVLILAQHNMIDSSSIISSSDNILIELVAEFYERTKQLLKLQYELLLLLCPLP
ncbi:unnamed protein product [Rotaria sp. Silwood2]|nr:unnamed protein product [Rotaria sp. Silwood2]CAF4595105.1 unnamed protein product [Rotaria sp. Silwood2]